MTQGILPTLMVVVVGLDLGVDTSAVTNSFASRGEVTEQGQRKDERYVDVETELVQADMPSPPKPVQIFLDIRRQSGDGEIQTLLITSS
jgi:hypothetical protein